jgi:hypothetical protein
VIHSCSGEIICDLFVLGKGVGNSVTFFLFRGGDR